MVLSKARALHMRNARNGNGFASGSFALSVVVYVADKRSERGIFYQGTDKYKVVHLGYHFQCYNTAFAWQITA